MKNLFLSILLFINIFVSAQQSNNLNSNNNYLPPQPIIFEQLGCEQGNVSCGAIDFGAIYSIGIMNCGYSPYYGCGNSTIMKSIDKKELNEDAWGPFASYLSDMMNSDPNSDSIVTIEGYTCYNEDWYCIGHAKVTKKDGTESHEIDVGSFGPSFSDYVPFQSPACMDNVPGLGCSQSNTYSFQLSRTNSINCTPITIAKPPVKQCSIDGNPIESKTGAKIDKIIDLNYPMVFQRSYSSLNTQKTLIGLKWKSNYDNRLNIQKDSNGNILSLQFVLSDNEEVVFIPDGIYFKPYYGDQKGYSVFYNSNNNYILTLPDNTVQTYDYNGKILKEKLNGKSIDYIYDNYDILNHVSNNSNLIKVQNNLNQWLVFHYSISSSVISSIEASNGDIITFDYISGAISNVKFNNINKNGYSYQGDNLLISKTDALGNTFSNYSYNDNNKAIETKWILGDKSIYQFDFNYHSNSTTVTQPNGYIKTYNFQTILYKKYLTAINTGNFTEGFDYDENGNLIRHTNTNNGVESFGYDNLNRLTDIQFVNGKTKHIVWDQNINVIRQIIESTSNGSKTTAFDYDNNLNISTITISGSGETIVYGKTWTNDGRISTETSPNGGITTYSYYDVDGTYKSGLLKTITNPIGLTISINDYDLRGNPTSITDENGITKTMSYDMFSNLLTETINTNTNTYEYDLENQLKKITFGNGYVVQMEYDNAHRLFHVFDNKGGELKYDLNDYNNEPNNFSILQNNNLINTVNNIFDNLNRVIQSKQNTNKTIKQYSYSNYLNMPNNIIDENGITSYFYQDSSQRLRGKNRPDESYNYSYDYDNNISQIIVNDQTTNYEYDDFNRLKKIISPDSGISNISYNTLLNKTIKTDAKGITHETTKDLIGRIITINHYDNSTSTNESYEYIGNNIFKISNEVSQNTYYYDNFNNIMQKNQQIDGKTFTIQYHYNNFNQMDKITYPSGLEVNLGHDTKFINSISANNVPIVSDIQFNTMKNQIKSWKLNGEQVNINIDADNLLSGFYDGTLNQTISTDNIGNITGVQDSNNNTNINVYYDQAYRLKGGSINNNLLDYRYSFNHNLFMIGHVQNATGSIMFDVSPYNNKLSNYQTESYFYYTYDANGNTLTDNKGSYLYDLKNNMISSQRPLGTGIYFYNSLNERVKKIVNNQIKYFVYNENQQLIGEYDSNGNVISEYIYMDNRPVALFKNGTLYIIHTDYLGTPRIIKDLSGNIVWKWEQADAYGNNQPQGIIEFNLRFSGQYYDNESGLHYNYYRMYNPEIGRYMQSDPIGLNGGANTYNYVEKNPLSGVDPLGLWSTAAHNILIDNFVAKYMPELKGQYGFIDAIKKGSAATDDWEYQKEDYSYMHSMTSTAWPNKKNAETMRDQTVKAYIKEAKRLINSECSGDWANGYYFLGMALHPIMDSTSPVHGDFNSWQLFSLDALKHGGIDKSPFSEESVKNLNPKIINITISKMNSYYIGVNK